MSFLHWTPRVLGIITIIFICLYALTTLQPDLRFGEQLGTYLKHLIPAYVLLGILILAWKNELLGGAVLILAALAATPLIFQLNYLASHSFKASVTPVLSIALPILIIGVLFIWDYLTRKHIHSEF